MQWGLGLYTAQVPADAGHDVHTELHRTVEQARLAESVGLDSIWLSEHHGADDGYLPSTLTVAAAILANTERLVVGTAVLLAPFHNPIRLAEDVAVLDQLSGGRFVLGLGAGWRLPEFRAFGVDPRQRVAALEETVEVLRLAWTGDPFDYHGRVHHIDGARVRPRPFTPGGPAIWLGGTGPRALERAGRLGEGHFGVGVPFSDGVTAFERALDSVPAERREQFAFGQMRSGFIAASADEAWYLAGRGMTYTLGVHRTWAAHDAGERVPPEGVVVDTDVVQAYNLLGSADDVFAGLRPYAERFRGRGDCHLAFRLYHPYTPYDRTLEAIEAYGRAVVPALRRVECER